MLRAITFRGGMHIVNGMFTERGENGLGSRWDCKGSGREQADERKGGVKEGEGNHDDGKSLFGIYGKATGVCRSKRQKPQGRRPGRLWAQYL